MAVATAVIKAESVDPSGTKYVRKTSNFSTIASAPVPPDSASTAFKYSAILNVVTSANSIMVSIIFAVGGAGVGTGSEPPLPPVPPEHEGVEQLDTSPIPG